MASLYHYCSSETLIKILQGKSLRLSDITKSNDSKEISFLYEKYLEWSRKENPELKDNSSCLFFNKYLFDNQLSQTIIFVSCFSTNEDDLYMWSQYGDNGKGVFIEFNKDEIEKLLENIKIGTSEEIRNNYPNISLGKAPIKFEKVEYLEDENADEFFRNHNCLPIGKDNQLKTLNKIIELCPSVKNGFFKQENEYRIFYTKLPDCSNGDSYKYINNLTYVNENKGISEILPFKSISSNTFAHKMVLDLPFDKSLIKSITLGPNCKLSEKDVKELFMINGFDELTVYKSKGTLR